ncbi:neuroblast differentiation-associated protein AHNAK-like isoform X2 [Synchiropus splendidus]|uniref:neuroblast differentiation-associated protein AHNAK-like isoform X2 n=1 Tax=Synchiropus splendidus TaxID=270530 RepID=UPI00237DCE22|nr:neuroblast differentiation-associated protein AHNAK-like isoform X2 [Synchiropus splendidus]
MCDCFHLAFPNWHDTSSGTGAGRRLRGPDPGGPDDSVCEEPSQYTEGERPRPQGSSPVDEYPETERFSDSDKEFETDRHSKKKEKKNRKSGFGHMFEKSSTPKMSKLKEAQSPDSGVIVKTAKDGSAEGLVYGGGGKEGIFIKEVVPESPASKSLKLREGDQILSATVYFDNVPYEDAVQILEHAQAYNVKLCLKRKPEITGVESDVIPEDGSYNLEMRDREKSRRRGDARISWPKFPTLGKGRKSHFKRSHSSSEADEQRKLELSPTTSDTESPVKSQDVLKGKKRNKMKLSSLTKTSRVTSSDGQDTDAPITGYEIETREMKMSLESPSKEVEGGEVDPEDSRQVIPQSPDKVELISIDTTLKSADLPSPTKSPDGKKKKKEKSEMKIRILGKDKSSKKDAKAKASPKRLKTLGASLDISERTKTEESDGTKSVDAAVVEKDSGKDQTDLSDIALFEESPQKSKEKTKKKRIKDKTSPKFKLPKIGFVDYTVEQSQKTMLADDQGCVTTQPGESKDDLYGSLSKDGFSRTQLPKREDIEIPGMEDASRKRINGNGETLQLSIDVNSVKEAVSKLPGYKLPQVDPDGVLIPAEIIVIDANAQRISVKSPTKVTDSSAKKGSKPDTLSCDVTSHGVEIPTDGIEYIDSAGSPDKEERRTALVTDIKVQADCGNAGVERTITLPKDGDDKAEAEAVQKVAIKTPDKQVMGGFFKMPTFSISMPKFTGSVVDSSKTSAVLPEAQVEVKTNENNLIAEQKLEIQTPTIEIKNKNNEFEEQNGQFEKSVLDMTIPKSEVSGEAEMEVPKTENQDQSAEMKLKSPDIKIEAKSATDSPSKFWMPKFKLPRFDIGFREVDTGVAINGSDINTEAKAGVDSAPTVELEGVSLDEKIKAEDDGQESKAKMPDLSLSMQLTKDVEVKVPEDQTVELKVELPTPAIDGKDSEVKLDGHGAKFKMPKFKIPKFGVGLATVSAEAPNVDTDVKVICSDFPVTEKDLNIASTSIGIDDSVTEIGGEVNIPNIEAGVKLPDVHQTAADSKPADGQADGRGGKFKMPKFGIRLPKVEVAEKELTLSQKDSNVTLATSEAKIKGPDFEPKDLTVDVNIKSPEVTIGTKNVDDSSKFKMPKFKLPKVGGGSATASIEVSDVDTDAQIKGADINIPEDEAVIDLVTPKVEVDAPSVEVKTTGSVEGGKGSKFRMPHLGISVPKVKAPKIDLKVSDCKAATEIPETGDTLGHGGILVPEQDIEVKLSEPHQTDADDKQSDKEVDGHGGKLKLPKFGIKMPKVKAPAIALTLPSKETVETSTEAGLEVPEAALEETSLNVEIKSPEIVAAAKSSDESTPKYKTKKFKLPKFGAKASTGKTNVGIQPIESEMEVDVNLTEKERNVVPPEVSVKIPHSSKFEADFGKIDVSIPAASGQKTDGESKGGLKMPVLGIKMPKLKGAEVDLSKKTEVSARGTKASVELTDIKPIEPIPTVGLKVDVQEGVKTTIKDLEEPKMEIDLERKTMQTEKELGTKDVHGAVEIEGSRFKMPKFGLSKPKFKVPEIDLNLKKTDVEVENKLKDVDTTLTAEITCPEMKTEVTLPDPEVKVPEAEVEIKALENDNTPENLNQSPSKFKLPSFKFPKFGGSPKVKVDVQVPELETEFQKEAPNLTGGKQEDVDLEFQMPKADLEASKPEIDLSQLKCDVPEVSLEVKGPEGGQELPSPDVEMKAPELNIGVQTAESSPSKFWLPSFKLPKFGFGVVSSTTVPDKDHDVIIDSQDEVVEIVLEKGQPSIDIKTKEEKEHMDVTLPSVQTNTESLCVDLRGDENVSTEINVPTEDTKGYQSKFKMPTFKVPKLGIGTPSATIEVPDVKKSLKVDGHEVVSIAAPALDMETPRLELEGKNTELVKLGLSVPEVKGPSLDISAPKQDVSVAIPSVEADVQLPDVETKDVSATVELKSPEMKAVAKTAKGSPSKFKMPSFKLPRIGIGSHQVTLDASGPSVDGNVDVEVACKPNIESARPEQESKEIKVELPQVEVKSPDVRTSSKDLDVALPEVTAEVELPDVKLESPAKVELKSSELKAELKGSPSKFKMPAFKIPKFGVGFSSGSTETPDVDKVKIDDKDEVLQVSIDIPQSDISLETKQQKGIEINLPKLRTSVPEVKDAGIDLNASNKEVDINLPAVGIDVQLPDIELKETQKVEVKSPEKKAMTVDAKGSPSKFKMPSFKLPKFGVSIPSATTQPPDVDSRLIIDENKEVGGLSIVLPDISTIPSMEVQMTGPEEHGKEIKTVPVDVQLPETEVMDSSATVEFKPPEIKGAIKETKGSASKFKMPSFKLPKIGIGTPNATVEEPEVDKSIQGNDEISAQISFETPEIGHEGKEVDLQLPTMGISGPEVKGSHLDMDPSQKIQMESLVKVDVKSPEVKAVLKEEKGSPSKFKMPSLKLPKIGRGSATVAVPEVDPSLKTEDKEEVISVSMVAPHSVVCSSVGIDLSGPQLEGKEVKLEQPNVDVSASHVDVTLPKVKAGVDHETKEAKVEMVSTEIKAATKDAKASPSKFKMPAFKLPKIGIGSSSATAEVPEIDSGLKTEGEAVEVSMTAPSITIESTKTEHEGKGVQIALPAQLKGPAVDITLPSIKSDIQLQDSEFKESSAKVEFETPGVKAAAKDAKGSPSKFKMPSLKLPKFGSQSAAVDVTKGNADVVVETTDEEHDRKEMEVQLSDIDSSAPKVDGGEVDISLLHKNVDVFLPKLEAEFHHEIKPPTLDISTDKAQDSSSDGTPATNLEDKIKKSKFSFPKFSFSKQTSKDFQVNASQPTVDVLIAEGKVEVIEPPAEVKLVESSAEIEGKEGKFKMPKLGISLTKPKSTESDLALSKTDDNATLPKVEITRQEVKEQAEVNAQANGSEREGTGSKFKIPSFGFSVQGGDNDGGLSTKDIEVQLPEVEAKVQLSEEEMEPTKMSETKAIETATEVKDAGGSPFKFKLPSLKMSLFRSQATTETSMTDKESETRLEGANLEEDMSVTESPVVEHEEDTSKPEISVAEETKTEDAPASPVSPSRFQLPLFKIPTLGFSRPQPEEEYMSVESKNDQLEIKVESKSPKSPKSALASVGDMMQNLTIEFDVSKEEVEHVETTNGTLEKQVEAKVKPKEDVQESPKRSDWGGWFKFPTFGLSSPSEQRKRENVDEEVSPTSSVQSSDAFADVSSTITSEPTGLSPSSPTKVTVKYTDPDDKIHSSITASTKRTQVISVEPMMAEKITNLSSGVSSSSEDTLRLESGKIHLLTSNIQATPESHHTKLVTYVHDQSEGGLAIETEAGGPRSPEHPWTGKIGFEKQVIQTQSSESRETVVITKQVTRVLNPAAEPITHETATSIRQLKETVHSEKMRFFDKAKK